MAYLMVNGVEVLAPSALSTGIQDISAPDSGRDLSGLMHKNKIGEKRTVQLTWNGLKPSEVAQIITAFQAQEYFTVTYWDPSNAVSQVTKTFYLGDRSAPVYNWALGLYESLSFQIIER